MFWTRDLTHQSATSLSIICGTNLGTHNRETQGSINNRETPGDSREIDGVEGNLSREGLGHVLDARLDHVEGVRHLRLRFGVYGSGFRV